MASEVFADSQGWIGLLNRSDLSHGAAAEAMSSFARDRRPIATTDWVLAETGNGLARTNARKGFVEAVARLQRSPVVTIVRISDSLFGQALEMFRRVEDKRWGLIDCASFVVMAERKLHEAFTNDRHFQQAGFRCLL